MVTEGFRRFGLHRIEIRCATWNHRSSAIPRRLGFVEEGILRESEWLHDKWVDLRVFSMLAQDWKGNATDWLIAWCALRLSVQPARSSERGKQLDATLRQFTLLMRAFAQSRAPGTRAIQQIQWLSNGMHMASRLRLGKAAVVGEKFDSPQIADHSWSQMRVRLAIQPAPAGAEKSGLRRRPNWTLAQNGNPDTASAGTWVLVLMPSARSGIDSLNCSGKTSQALRNRKGSRVGTWNEAKSFVFLVTIVSPCIRAVATMKASSNRASDLPFISRAHWRQQSASGGDMRMRAPSYEDHRRLFSDAPAPVWQEVAEIETGLRRKQEFPEVRFPTLFHPIPFVDGNQHCRFDSAFGD